MRKKQRSVHVIRQFSVGARPTVQRPQESFGAFTDVLLGAVTFGPVHVSPRVSPRFTAEVEKMPGQADP